MAIRLNGIAHVYITVADFAVARPFYGRLLPYLDMECLIDTEVLYYCVGSRTGIAIRAASAEHADTPFDQYRAGLHHLCLRARTREDVDAVAAFVQEIGGRLVHASQEDDWAPGYYSVLFEDPCGTRLEVNYVPGKGNLAEEVELPLPAERQARLSEP
ncbi:MAG: VOC family protein [Pseudomonadales bacterium]|jgi:catechol 2,3-dioxygenase-like lactoylglutathione lyase family enzyme|nr:VOC family protein [Pseudomonadales bacterium]